MNTALVPVFADQPKAHGEANATLVERLQQIDQQHWSQNDSPTQWADTEVSPLLPH